MKKFLFALILMLTAVFILGSGKRAYAYTGGEPVIKSFENNSKFLTDEQAQAVFRDIRKYIEGYIGKGPIYKMKYIWIAFTDYDVEFEDVIYDGKDYINIWISVDMLPEGKRSEPRSPADTRPDSASIPFVIELLGNNEPMFYEGLNVTDPSINYKIYSRTGFAGTVEDLYLIDKKNIREGFETVDSPEYRMQLENIENLEYIYDDYYEEQEQ